VNHCWASNVFVTTCIKQVITIRNYCDGPGSRLHGGLYCQPAIIGNCRRTLTGRWGSTKECFL